MFKMKQTEGYVKDQFLAAMLFSAAILVGLFIRPQPVLSVTPINPQIISAAMIPLHNSVLETDSNDLVAIAGTLHLVTNVSATDSGHDLTVQASMPPVDAATSSASGDAYIAYGAVSLVMPIEITDPLINPIEATSVIMPIDLTNPLQVAPLNRFTLRNMSQVSSDPEFFNVTLKLYFDGSGNLIPEVSSAEATK